MISAYVYLPPEVLLSNLSVPRMASPGGESIGAFSLLRFPPDATVSVVGYAPDSATTGIDFGTDGNTLLAYGQGVLGVWTGSIELLVEVSSSDGIFGASFMLSVD